MSTHAAAEHLGRRKRGVIQVTDGTQETGVELYIGPDVLLVPVFELFARLFSLAKTGCQ